MAARKRKKSGRKSHRRKRSGMSGIPNGLVQEVLGGAAGALGATMVAKVPIPGITDPKILQVLPLVAGVILYIFAKGNAIAQTAGLVMASVGAANLAKTYVPGLGEICGESTLQSDLEFIDGIEEATSLQGDDSGELQGSNTADYEDQY